MKKFIFCATLVVLFTSCMKNDVEVDAVQRTEDFTATFEDGTRADLDGTAVVWNADDHLTIFTKTSHNRQYKVKDLSANGRSATFEYVGYTGSDKTPITNNYAVYPYDATATISGDVITTAFASEQIYNAERDLTYALMSAKSSTNNFSFVNSGALLRFNISTILPDTFDLNYMKVSSQSHNIAGEVTIDTNDHLAVVTNNGTNEITLAEINETIDSDVKSFYIAMPAMSFEKSDLSVTFSFADGDKTFTLPAFDLEQGKIKSIDYVIKDADEFTGSTPGEDEPATAKPANNEIWYTNGSTTTATEPYDASVFGVNIISNTYDANKECWVISFDDAVTSIGERAFYYCSSPTSITIPDSVTTIGNSAFYGCSNLTSVNIPDSVTTIGYQSFYNCRSLTSVSIPYSVTTIGKRAFGECNKLTRFNGKFASEDGRCLIVDGTLNSFAPGDLSEYTIPDNVTTIANSAFYGCKELTSVTIPESVTKIEECAFGWCAGLASITIPESVTFIEKALFYNCHGLAEFKGKYASEDGRCLIFDGMLNSYAPAGIADCIIADGVTSIGDAVFENYQGVISATIPASVTSFGDGSFWCCRNLKSVYCKATIPPTTIPYSGYWHTFDFNASDRKIYVPMESVEAYRSASGWKNYANEIVAYDFKKDEVYDARVVDLGLSVNWASCNVGANSPEEYGDYFAWGEIYPKDSYTTQTYQYWTDYNGDGSWDSGEYSDLGDITGNPQYDAATANWGGAWRMPTKAEQEELLNNCTWEWTTLNGVNGQRVTGPNGNSIFLPAAGSRVGTSSYDVGSDGDYWSSTPGEGNDGSAYDLFFGSGFYDWLWINRRDGHSVRPVLE